VLQKKIKQISSADTLILLQHHTAMVDIRRPDEWNMTGIVAGSHLLTFFDAWGSSHPEKWLRQLDNLIPIEQPLLLI